MIFPGTEIELELYRRGFEFVIGIDEVGRGPLAGPVVAAAAWINPEMLEKNFPQKNLIRDSKTLSPKQREKIFCYLQDSGDLIFGIGEVESAIIDKINILNGALLAMRIAVEDLTQKLSIGGAANVSRLDRCCLLIDGNKKIPRLAHKQKIFAQGDKKIFSISAASICAKVYRDGLMEKVHHQYPVYGFLKHKGYGTKDHLKALKKFGPCAIHRKSFGPVARLK